MLFEIDHLESGPAVLQWLSSEAEGDLILTIEASFPWRQDAIGVEVAGEETFASALSQVAEAPKDLQRQGTLRGRPWAVHWLGPNRS
ncbi:hypothetical protein ACFFV7_27730 [Nonomuraea spiralis]|uniref:Uncharacterized protein n=1 Tax=Nonomuraea spiralis TaxID=46182 RepID=A0ABV5IKG2_9ACTN|nr:hypothetical protein [Nonomuraea spiralis]